MKLFDSPACTIDFTSDELKLCIDAVNNAMASWYQWELDKKEEHGKDSSWAMAAEMVVDDLLGILADLKRSLEKSTPVSFFRGVADAQWVLEILTDAKRDDTEDLIKKLEAETV